MQLKLRLYRKICEDQSYHDNLCIIKSVRSVRSVWPIKILRFSCVSQDFFVSLHWQFEMSVRLRAAAQQCPDKPTLHSPCTAIVSAEEQWLFMSQNPRTYGRTELAVCYFPRLQPMSAWLKLKSLLSENPDLAPLSQLKRRSFLPAEVAKIYESLGRP